MNKTSGIMFKAEMILAYLAGIKGQTRRTKRLGQINADPDAWRFNGFMDGMVATFFTRDRGQAIAVRAPYGKVGDTLYFMETWKMWEREEDGKDFLHYRADDAKVDPTWWTEEDWRAPNPFWFKKDVFKKWQPSMFMPFGCARIRNVPILRVRVERLQSISEADADAEGMASRNEPFYNARHEYEVLWNKINGKNLPWEKNPWVWVYEFQKYEVQ
jgi:hypothetical protein